MMYCPICGYFSVTNEQTHPQLNCHDPWHHYTEEERQKIKMLPVTTENFFCGRCNKIFSKNVGQEWKICPHCARQPLAQITESHLKAGESGGFVILSGLTAEKVWE